jgi:hypothetical protein
LHRPALSIRAAAAAAATLAVVAATAVVPTASAERAGDAGGTGDAGATGDAAAKRVTSRVLFHFKDSRITESSGIETSARFRKVLYTHNDSGDSARFFAVGPKGQTRAVYTLNGASNHDWEDMSQGPNRTLWFGDIGSNAVRDGTVTVYRVKEPKRLRSRSVHWTAFDFRYEDGPHNAESLMVNPVSGDLYIVSKGLDDNSIYKASRPFSTAHANVLRKVAAMNVTGKTTGADFTSNGKRFVIRTYGAAFFGRRIGGHLTAVPLPLSGESIAFTRNNKNVVTSQEGVGTPVYKVFIG